MAPITTSQPSPLSPTSSASSTSIAVSDSSKADNDLWMKVLLIIAGVLLLLTLGASVYLFCHRRALITKARKYEALYSNAVVELKKSEEKLLLQAEDFEIYAEGIIEHIRNLKQEDVAWLTQRLAPKVRLTPAVVAPGEHPEGGCAVCEPEARPGPALDTISERGEPSETEPFPPYLEMVSLTGSPVGSPVGSPTKSLTGSPTRNSTGNQARNLTGNPAGNTTSK
ncbi:hypothetical protein G7046_g5848 [Stylonectria norvegica]|nr:hypothetical protein G7046_g5848 [Stylonectria norvegica]